MTMPPQGGRHTGNSKVDAGRLWAGGVATAVIAALVAVVGVLIARGIFDVDVLAPEGAGVWGDSDTTRYALSAALGALIATALIHMLILFAPRYSRFFTWIMVLATTVAVLAPFAVDTDRSVQVATALINLFIGLAIGTLVAGSARSAIAAAAASGGAIDQYPPEAYPPGTYPPR